MSLFSDRLALARKTINLTQKDMADFSGVTRSAYSAWEIGRNEPPLSFIYDFCKTYKISADYLLGLSDSINPPLPISIPHYDVPRDPLSDLDDDLKNKVDGYIDSIRQIQNERNASSQQEA